MSRPHRLSPLLGLTALAALLPATAPPAAAQTAVIGFPVPNLGAEINATAVGETGYSLGFAFTANSAISVTSLGYLYDPTYDPATFAQPHAVGLYTESGTLLTSAFVTSKSTQDGYFLYASIVPATLVLGQQYVIAGETGATDPYWRSRHSGLAF